MAVTKGDIYETYLFYHWCFIYDTGGSGCCASCFTYNTVSASLCLVFCEKLKAHLDSFVQHRSMTRKTKASLLTFASLMLLAAMYFMNNLWLRLFLFALMLFKYYYFLFRIKTIRQ